MKILKIKKIKINFKFIAMMLIQAFWVLDCFWASGFERLSYPNFQQSCTLAPQVKISSTEFQQGYYNLIKDYDGIAEQMDEKYSFLKIAGVSADYSSDTKENVILKLIEFLKVKASSHDQQSYEEQKKAISGLYKNIEVIRKDEQLKKTVWQGLIDFMGQKEKLIERYKRIERLAEQMSILMNLAYNFVFYELWDYELPEKFVQVEKKKFLNMINKLKKRKKQKEFSAAEKDEVERFIQALKKIKDTPQIVSIFKYGKFFLCGNATGEVLKIMQEEKICVEPIVSYSRVEEQFLKSHAFVLCTVAGFEFIVDAGIIPGKFPVVIPKDEVNPAPRAKARGIGEKLLNTTLHPPDVTSGGFTGDGVNKDRDNIQRIYGGTWLKAPFISIPHLSLNSDYEAFGIVREPIHPELKGITKEEVTHPKGAFKKLEELTSIKGKDGKEYLVKVTKGNWFSIFVVDPEKPRTLSGISDIRIIGENKIFHGEVADFSRLQALGLYEAIITEIGKLAPFGTVYKTSISHLESIKELIRYEGTSVKEALSKTLIGHVFLNAGFNKVNIVYVRDHIEYEHGLAAINRIKKEQQEGDYWGELMLLAIKLSSHSDLAQFLTNSELSAELQPIVESIQRMLKTCSLKDKTVLVSSEGKILNSLEANVRRKKGISVYEVSQDSITIIKDKEEAAEKTQAKQKIKRVEPKREPKGTRYVAKTKKEEQKLPPGFCKEERQIKAILDEGIKSENLINELSQRTGMTGLRGLKKYIVSYYRKLDPQAKEELFNSFSEKVKEQFLQIIEEQHKDLFNNHIPIASWERREEEKRVIGPLESEYLSRLDKRARGKIIEKRSKDILANNLLFIEQAI